MMENKLDIEDRTGTGKKDNTNQTLPNSQKNLLLPVEDPAKNLNEAVFAIKKLHKEHASDNTVARVTATKLNASGASVLKGRLEGKDLIIEDASQLSSDNINFFVDLIKTEGDKRSLVFVDTANGLQKLIDKHTELIQLCGGYRPYTEVNNVADSLKKAEQTRQATTKPENKKPENKMPEPKKSENQKDTQGEPEAKKKEEVKPEPKKQTATKPVVGDERFCTEELSGPDFEAYEEEYLRLIDCSMSTKGKQALHNDALAMHRSGYLLTREHAEKYVEDAADRADKRGNSKLLDIIQGPKYDEQNCLILRHDHFKLPREIAGNAKKAVQASDNQRSHSRASKQNKSTGKR